MPCVSMAGGIGRPKSHSHTIFRLFAATMLTIIVISASGVAAVVAAAVASENAVGDGQFNTVAIDKSVPFSTGTPPTDDDPLFAGDALWSTLTGPNRDVFLCNYYYTPLSGGGFFQAVGVRAFNATTGKQLYLITAQDMLPDDSQGDLSLKFSAQQRAFVINQTHFFFGNLQVTQGEYFGMIPSITVVETLTGKTALFLNATYTSEMHVTESGDNQGLFVTVARPQQGLFFMSDGKKHFVLNLQNNTFMATRNDTMTRVFSNTSNIFVSTNGFPGRQLLAEHFPSGEVMWRHNYPTTASIVSVAPFTVNRDREVSSDGTPFVTVPTLLATHNSLLCRNNFRLSFVDVESGVSTLTVSLSDQFPFLQQVCSDEMPGVNQGSNIFKLENVPGEKNMVVLVIENINDDLLGDQSNQTCGVILLDVKKGAVAWKHGFDEVTESTERTHKCEWHTDPSGRFGWLVRNDVHSYQPKITVLNVSSGDILATAGAGSSSSSSTTNGAKKSGVSHLQLPLASTSSNAVTSALFGDVLLLYYQLSGVPKTIFTGIRLASSKRMKFAGNFEIDVSAADGFDTNLKYTLQPRLIQRSANNTMIVPLIDLKNGKSRLLWVDIGNFGHNNSSKSLSASMIAFIAVGCILGVIAVAVVSVVVLKKKRFQSAGARSAIQYENVNSSVEYGTTTTNGTGETPYHQNIQSANISLKAITVEKEEKETVV